MRKNQDNNYLNSEKEYLNRDVPNRDYPGRAYQVRLLLPEEIECRIATISEKGVSLLLYKDARVDQKILDESFGIFGWKRSHQCLDGNLYCTVEVLDRETGCWISKQDVGTNGLTEKEKSQASDSFKRACFNWGIGRELYSAPFIWIPAGKANIQKKEEKKLVCYDRFSVTSITYNDSREIIALRITNEWEQEVFSWQEKGAIPSPESSAGQRFTERPLPEAKGQSSDPNREQSKALSKEQLGFLQAELKRTGVEMEAVKERYQVSHLESMSQELYGRVMKALAKTKSAHVA